MSYVSTSIGRVSSGLAWLILRLGFAGSGRAVGPLSFWFVWQWITNRYYRLKPIRPGGLFRYRITTYRGRVFALEDGTVMARGDRLAELHFDNATLAGALRASSWGKESAARTWRLARVAAADLSALAVSGRLDPDVKAVRGLTLLAPAAPRFGFEVRLRRRTVWNNLLRFFMLGLLTIYNPTGKRRLAGVDHDTYPAEVWLSRRQLDRRFGREAAS